MTQQKFALVTFITSRLLLGLCALGFLRVTYPAMTGDYYWFLKVFIALVNVFLIGYCMLSTVNLSRVGGKSNFSWNIGDEENVLLSIILLFFLPLILAMNFGVINKIIYQDQKYIELLDFIKSMESVWGPY